MGNYLCKDAEHAKEAKREAAENAMLPASEKNKDPTPETVVEEPNPDIPYADANVEEDAIVTESDVLKSNHVDDKPSAAIEPETVHSKSKDNVEISPTIDKIESSHIVNVQAIPVESECHTAKTTIEPHVELPETLVSHDAKVEQNETVDEESSPVPVELEHVIDEDDKDVPTEDTAVNKIVECQESVTLSGDVPLDINSESADRVTEVTICPDVLTKSEIEQKEAVESYLQHAEDNLEYEPDMTPEDASAPETHVEQEVITEEHKHEVFSEIPVQSEKELISSVEIKASGDEETTEHQEEITCDIPVPPEVEEKEEDFQRELTEIAVPTSEEMIGHHDEDLINDVSVLPEFEETKDNSQIELIETTSPKDEQVISDIPPEVEEKEKDFQGELTEIAVPTSEEIIGHHDEDLINDIPVLPEFEETKDNSQIDLIETAAPKDEQVISDIPVEAEVEIKELHDQIEVDNLEIEESHEENESDSITVEKEQDRCVDIPAEVAGEECKHKELEVEQLVIEQSKDEIIEQDNDAIVEANNETIEIDERQKSEESAEQCEDSVSKQIETNVELSHALEPVETDKTQEFEIEKVQETSSEEVIKDEGLLAEKHISEETENVESHEVEHNNQKMEVNEHDIVEHVITKTDEAVVSHEDVSPESYNISATIDENLQDAELTNNVAECEHKPVMNKCGDAEQHVSNTNESIFNDEEVRKVASKTIDDVMIDATSQLESLHEQQPDDSTTFDNTSTVNAIES